jgi:hypothetical protein
MSLLIDPLKYALARPHPAPGTGFNITATVIADTSTPVPGQAGNFDFLTYPVTSHGTVAFLGAARDQQQSIYSSTNGKLTLALPAGAPIPSTGGTFTGFSLPVPSQQALLFVGAGSLNTLGLYVKSGEILRRIVDTFTPVPSGVGNFTSFAGNGIAFDVQGAIVFVGTDKAGNQGIYSSSFPGGGAFVVANSSTRIPGGSGTFDNFAFAAVNAYGIAFFGGQSANPVSSGLYLSRQGSLSLLANAQTAVPGMGGTFNGFGTPVIAGTSVVFHAKGTNGSDGIYMASGSSLSVIADQTTPVPGGSGTFQSFFMNDPSIDERGNVAFLAGYETNKFGIFARVNGSLRRILTSDDTLNGKPVMNLGISTNQLSQGLLAFYALTSPGVFGIYSLPVG